MMKLSTEQLEVFLGENHILKGIDLEVKDNKFIGIIGPNGSGKSTLLKCIYRVLKPSSGIIHLNDQPMTSYPLKESAKFMGVVSQHNFYNFDFTVQDMVLMGRAPHKKAMERDTAEDYEIMYNALESVGMRSFAKRSFSSLSGGEQQRIILARALAQETKCLILDEPTNHLDIKYQLQLMDIVKSLGIPVIAAIHDLNTATMYCDEIYVMKDGQIDSHGKPYELITEELIYDIFDVNSKVIKDTETKEVNIIYKPSYRKLEAKNSQQS